jgi:putative ABC transport system ATP-binding protein
MNNDNLIIILNKIFKTYSDNGVPVEALKGVGLAVKQGEFTVIAGPSGSGKTTLLNIIGTLDIPTSGTVILQGEDIKSKSKKQLSDLRLDKLGFIFQAYNLIPVLTAIENIEFSMMLKGIHEKERRLKAIAVMEELDIADMAKKKPNQMSGGQQQRVAVARAIVNDPLIVLADEPTANIDSKTGENLLNLMLKMNREKNITFLFSSHDRQVMEFSRRLITLKDGLIVDDVLKN